MRTKLWITAFVVILFSCSEKKDKNPEEIAQSTAPAPGQVVTEVDDSQPNDKIRVFRKYSSAESGIDFFNGLRHNMETMENLFDYDYFYNGGGVGIEDLNNDGLKDIFFCGNQVPNRLYINKGDLQFEDISETANINDAKVWSNGVTFVDINGDGWMDIYVSQGGPHQKENRKNLLYINQKDNSFKEMAEAYNLADTGISTQAAFFDYDKDGDLDCVVMNENELYGVDPRRFFKTMEVNKEILKKSSSHLYRNDGGKFVDVTESAGLLRPTFGLGLSVSDLNNDGWLDIYIANDYYIPDALYINNGDGSFTDQIKNYTNQVSFYGMGVDIEDINNDGFQDIFVLDMASSDHYRAKTLMASMDVPTFNMLVQKMEFQHQYMFNSLQINMGNNRFNNVSQAAKLSKTDWSWAGLMVDLDNDEHKDIYITNGYRRYALDNDIRTRVVKAKQEFSGNVPLDVKEQIYGDMPSEKLPNVMLRNHQDLSFKEVGNYWGLGDPSFSNGAAYADLDNDGDLELITNNIDEEAFLYKNLSVEEGIGNYLRVKTVGNTSEAFARVTISYKDKKQFVEAKRVRGYLSAVDNTGTFRFRFGKRNRSCAGGMAQREI